MKEIVMKKYIIKGDPIPLARPRLARGHLYYAQKHQQQLMREDIEKQRGSLPLFDHDPLLLSVTFFLGLPPIHTKRKEGDFHIIKPNLSYLIKIIEEAGRGILYKDDALIACIITRKKYALEPRTEFSLEVIQHEEE